VTAAASTVPGTDIAGALWRASTAAVQHEDCSRCGARPGQPCETPGYTDLCRFLLAFMDGKLKDGDVALAMRVAVFYGYALLVPTLGGEA
jgi:hypothetical protein